MCKSLHLYDVWREAHPEKQQFTWRRTNPSVACRLDFFLLQSSFKSKVISTDIRPAVRTDHQGVMVQITTLHEGRGPGLWRFNNSLCQDKNYRKFLKQTVECIQNRYKEEDSRTLWELCKKGIKEKTIQYSKQKARLRSKCLQALEKELLVQETKLNNLDSESLLEYNQTKERLEKFYEYKATGARIRARTRYYEEGEKSTKLFLNLERKNNKKHTITKLIGPNNQTTTNNDQILKQCKDFYKGLYTSRQVPDETVEEFLEKIDIPLTLTQEDREILDKTPHDREFQNALSQMKTGKTPGSDGLTVEFYHTFWDIVGQLVINSISEGLEKGELSLSQRKAILKLLYKNGQENNIENWRPISLLNVDFKILSHVLANRLKPLLPKLINENQTAYIKGRCITQNIRLLLDVMTYTETENIPGILLFLDLRKAFDSVEWNFLFRVLEKYNFGNEYISWIKTIYNNCKSGVINNGWISDFFVLSRGVRQGCPLSAILFLFVTEILALYIDQNNDILGIKIRSGSDIKEVKISQVADDTTLLLRDEQSVHIAIESLSYFSKVAGPELNLNKTQALWAGCWKFRKKKIPGISTPETAIKSLGIYFGYDKKECEEKNWNNKVTKIENILNMWKSRTLTLYGKVTVLKTLIMSQITYCATSLVVPENIIVKLNNLFYNFLWSGKRDKIKRTVVIAEYEKGGLGMVDVKSQIEALHASIIRRLMDNTSGDWKLIPRMYLNSLGNDFLILKMHFKNSSDSPCLKHIPLYYRKVILSWHKAGGGNVSEPLTPEEVKNHIIWGSSHVINHRSKKRSTTLYFKNWINSGIIYVRDLLDENNCINEKNILDKLRDKKDCLVEIYKVKNAIPRSWITLLNDVHCQSTEQSRQEFDYKKYTCKYLYNKLILDKLDSPHSLETWASTFDRNLESFQIPWIDRTIYFTTERKLSNFMYKLLHRILPCNNNLYKWKIIDSPLCNICKVTENEEHMFFSCARLENFWERVSRFLYVIKTNSNINNFETCILGIPRKVRNSKAGNHILAIALYSIFKSWVLYKDKKCFSNTNCFTLFYRNLKNAIVTERNLSESRAGQKWGEIIPLVM